MLERKLNCPIFHSCDCSLRWYNLNSNFHFVIELTYLHVLFKQKLNIHLPTNIPEEIVVIL